MVYLYILIFITGLILGSFYMVVGLRLPKEKSIIKPGSHCPNCQHKLKWYELFPVFSYIFQKGKCRKCNTKISIIYPLTEILTALLFVLCFYLYGISYEFFAALIISSVLIIILISDLKYLIILDSPLIIGSILIFILKFIYFGFKPALLALASAILVFAFMYGVRNLGNIKFKRESLGGGDVKLAFFIGIVLGVRLGLTAIIVSCFLALPFSLLIMKIKKSKEIPFGPFLALAILLVFIFTNPIAEILNSLIFKQ